MNVYLETNKLILRQFVEADFNNLVELNSDPEVMRYINGRQATNHENIKNKLLKTIADYQTDQKYGFWASIEKRSNKFIGWFHFLTTTDFNYLTQFNLVTGNEIALGYRLNRDHWNRGFASEGSKAIIAKGFSELGVSKVVSWALIENKASIRVMEKAGLKREKEFCFSENQLPNLLASERQAVMYSLNKDDFIAKHNN
jgi:[ribosomal protein S5]-alanine N-acetyltransferase